MRFTQGSLALRFTPYAGRFGGPFFIVGGGGSRFETTEGPSVEQNQGNFEVGAGVQFWMTDKLGLSFERAISTGSARTASPIR